MKSITIHKLDDDLAGELELHARREGGSINRLVKRLLRASLGLDKPAAINRRADFEDLFGGWSEEEEQGFKRRMADLEHVSPDERVWPLAPA